VFTSGKGLTAMTRQPDSRAPVRAQQFATIAAIAAAAIAAAAISPWALAAEPKANSAKQSAQWPVFTEKFDALTDQEKIVGAGIVLIRDGRIVAHHEHGLADSANGVRITPQTIYHYGSITKTLTAIAIMQLRDRGRLSLDDRITTYIPELRQVHDPFGSMDAVTLRMLMSHSAGFQDPTWPYKQGKPWEPFEPTTWNQLVAMFPYQEVAFEPGSRYSYSNPGFIYLARVIEQLTGDPWESYVQKNIFSPLGMTHSYFRTTPYYLASQRSHNYTRIKDTSGVEIVTDNGADFDPGITIPNGGWNAPLTDLAIYLAFLTNSTHGDAATQRLYDTVLKHSTLTEMWQPLYKTAEDGSEIPEDAVGLSFFSVRHGRTVFVGHTGNQAGFRAFLFLNPDTGAGVIAAVNTDSDLPPPSRPTPYQQIRDLALDLIQ
jgi:CubicO group peptidase (beta-lactamase class C family)